MQLSEKTFDISPSYRPRNENERSRKATEPAKESDRLKPDRPTVRSASSNASAKSDAFHTNIKYGKTSSAGSDSLRVNEKARIAGYISPHPVRKQIRSFVPISFRFSPHRHRPTKNDAATNGTSRKGGRQGLGEQSPCRHLHALTPSNGQKTPSYPDTALPTRRMNNERIECATRKPSCRRESPPYLFERNTRKDDRPAAATSYNRIRADVSKLCTFPKTNRPLTSMQAVDFQTSG